MPATPSTMLDLGTKAPDFSLPDVTTGSTISLKTFGGKKALVVMFLCHHCPFVKHVSGELARLGRDYAGSSVGILAISANDPAVSSDDSPEGLKRMAAEWGLSFPVCHDESQEVGYAAARTPDLYLFDEGQAAGLSRPARREPAGQQQTGYRRRPQSRD
jgi:peroxiredoxin